MPVSFSNLVPAKYIENSQNTQYIAVGVVAIIDKISITNVTSVNATVTINIVPAAGTLDNSNIILNQKTIIGGETYLVPEIVGQILNVGEFISTLASAPSTLTLRISGRQIA